MTSDKSEISERIVTYSQADSDRWRDNTSVSWAEFIPEPARGLAHLWRTQAANGYHFAEVLQMRELHEAGLSWLYEDYALFKTPGRYSKKDKFSHAVVVEAFGSSQIGEVQALAEAKRRELGLEHLPPSMRKRMGPKIPDLFAYWRIDDTVFPVRFVELKRDDSLMPGQRLGMAIIQKVLGTPVELVRYVPEGSKVRAKTYPLPAV
jgi:hypothetical protein